jgi:hypothetical protein
MPEFGQGKHWKPVSSSPARASAKETRLRRLAPGAWPMLRITYLRGFPLPFEIAGRVVKAKEDWRMLATLIKGTN